MFQKVCCSCLKFHCHDGDCIAHVFLHNMSVGLALEGRVEAIICAEVEECAWYVFFGSLLAVRTENSLIVNVFVYDE